jgi:polar amino acid transport system substrate-binding protein
MLVMRKALLAFVPLAAALAVVATATGAHPSATAIPGCAPDSLNLVKSGQLTLGTDNPAFPPWWDGQEKKGTGFKTSNPYSGKGYESAVAYAVAKRLGFASSAVKWIAVQFTKSYAPGKKPFDFYLAQVSYKPVRAKAVAFSVSYYDVNQAVVGLKGKPIAKVKTIAGLKPYKLGVPIGTTSYDYVVNYVKPSPKPHVFDTLNDAVTALKNGQIDGLVVDFPSTGYITAVQVPNSAVVGRLPNQGKQEHFGLVFAKGNSFVGCVNKALTAMRKDGTLKRLEATWLAKAGGAPLLK